MALLPPERPRRLVYLGSPALAVPPLEALVSAGHEVALVVSRPDARRGRGRATSPSPVKEAALRLGLPVTAEVADVVEVGADLGVVVAYGRILRPAVLDRLAFVNLHFSLLPRWRGAAPVERALLAGDETTGVCVMAMEEGLDTGPTFRCAELPITADDTLGSLRHRLVEAGTGLLLACLSEGFGDPEPQRGEPTYATKIDVAELELRWDEPAPALARVAALERAWTTFRGKRLLVPRARAVAEADVPPALRDAAPGALDGVVVRAGEGALQLLEVQPEGRARQDAAAWRNGARPGPGERLGR